MAKLKEKLDALEGKKRFDPSKAFQPHMKENELPAQRRHLRDGNLLFSRMYVYCIV